MEEIGEHISVPTKNNPRNGDKIGNALTCLKLLGLIDYEDYYDNQKPRKRLTDVSLYVKDPNR